MPVRFRFCGDDEVPDWILAAINEMSYLETGKLKVLAESVVEAILDPEYTIENDNKLKLPPKVCEKKVSVAAILFILQNAVGYEVTEGTLSNELQQIGLPHEHAIVLCKIYTEKASSLKSKAKQFSLRCSIPKAVNCRREGDSFLMDLKSWQAHSNSIEAHSFSCTKEQLELMIDELNSVYERIDALV